MVKATCFFYLDRQFAELLLKVTKTIPKINNVAVDTAFDEDTDMAIFTTCLCFLQAIPNRYASYRYVLFLNLD